MKRINLQPLSAFNGSGANGYGANLDLRLGTAVTYKELYLKLANLSVAQITRVIITLNGSDIVNLTGTQLHLLQKYKGEHTQNNMIVIPFSDHTQSRREGQNMSELVTLPSDILILKVETGAKAANAPADAVANVQASAMYGIAKTQRISVPMLKRISFQHGQAGAVSHASMFVSSPNANPIVLRRMHLQNDKIDKVEIKIDKLSRFNCEKDFNEFTLKRFGHVPQNGVYTVDSVAYGFASFDALTIPSRQDFDVVITTDAAGDFGGILETIEILKAPVFA